MTLPDAGRPPPVAAPATNHPRTPGAPGAGATRVVRAALAALCLGGVFICGVLTRMSQPAADGESISSVFCAPSARVNCDYVLSSDAAKFGPVPVALIGMGYFAALLLWFVAVGLPNHPGRRWHAAPMALSSAGLLASLYYMYLMAFELPVWCTWCLAAHAVNAAVFLLALYAAVIAGRNREGQARPTSLRAGATLAAALCTAIFVLFGGWAVIERTKSARMYVEYLRVTNDIDYIVWQHRRAAANDIPIQPDDIVIGDIAAPHTLVVYSDFECDACAELHRNMAGLIKTFPGVRCVLRNYPMSTACNPNLKQSMRVFACDAARAVVAFAWVEPSTEARAAYTERLFKNRKRFAEQPYAALIDGLTSANRASFEAAMSGDRARGRLSAQIETGRALGVEGTPAMFLDGRRLSNWRVLRSNPPGAPDIEGTASLWDRLLSE